MVALSGPRRALAHELFILKEDAAQPDTAAAKMPEKAWGEHCLALLLPAQIGYWHACVFLRKEGVLLAQEASRRATAITAEKLAEARERVAAGYKTTEAFRRRLSDAGFTDASFNEYLRQGLLCHQILAELIREAAEPEDTEVLQVYRENRERYVLPERIRARHILLRVNAGASEREREAVRLRLLALAQQISNGADFAELARQYSEDSSRQSGGDLGYFPRGKMVPAFEVPAFGLPTGKLSEPVQTPYGWHLMCVEDHQAVRAMPEAEAVDMIRRQLTAAHRAEAERHALLNLRKEAQVEVLLPLLR